MVDVVSFFLTFSTSGLVVFIMLSDCSSVGVGSDFKNLIGEATKSNLFCYGLNQTSETNPLSDAYWQAEYFNNVNLQGTPIYTETVSDLNRDFSSNRPSLVPSQYFSARWTKNEYFNKGFYYFILNSDDGIRFYIDNVLTLVDWTQHGISYPGPKIYSTNLNQGLHNLKVEYFQSYGSAAISYIDGSFYPPINTAQNLLRNSDFLSNTNEYGWHYHSPQYVLWDTQGYLNPGSLHMTLNYGNSYEPGNNCTEVWQGIEENGVNVAVHGGDKIIFEGWIKTGKTIDYTSSGGSTVGFDLYPTNLTLKETISRERSLDDSPGILAAMNGPGTTNKNWTYFYFELIVPCIVSSEHNLATSIYLSEGSNSKYTSGLGYYYFPPVYPTTGSIQLIGKPFPETHPVIWLGTGITEEAWFDNLKFSIVRNVVSCSS